MLSQVTNNRFSCVGPEGFAVGFGAVLPPSQRRVARSVSAVHLRPFEVRRASRCTILGVPASRVLPADLVQRFKVPPVSGLEIFFFGRFVFCTGQRKLIRMRSKQPNTSTGSLDGLQGRSAAIEDSNIARSKPSRAQHRATSAFAILRAAQECETFAEAAERLQVSNLGELLADNQALRAAWDRGRLLRRLGELGASPFCRRAVAERLNLSEEKFTRLLAMDAEASDTFEQARHVFFLNAKGALLTGARKGEQYASKALERLLAAEAGTQREAPDPIDFNRLTVTQIAEATGISRTQISRWSKNHHLPRNADGTFSMPQFVAWLRKSPHGQTRAYRRKPAAVEKRILTRIQTIITEEMASVTSPENPPENQGD